MKRATRFRLYSISSRGIAREEILSSRWQQNTAPDLGRVIGARVGESRLIARDRSRQPISRSKLSETVDRNRVRSNTRPKRSYTNNAECVLVRVGGAGRGAKRDIGPSLPALRVTRRRLSFFFLLFFPLVSLFLVHTYVHTCSEQKVLRTLVDGDN